MQNRYSNPQSAVTMSSVMQMIEKIVGSVSRYMVKKGAVSSDDIELAAFGLESLIADAMQIAILLALSLLFEIVIPMLLYCIFYTVLRRYVGGAHAKTHVGCICSFAVSAVFIVHSGLYFPARYAPALLCGLALYSVVVVFLVAPVTHPDCPRSEQSIARFKKRGRVAVIIEGIIMIFSALLSPGYLLKYFLCAGLGCAVTSTLLLLGTRKNKQLREKGGILDEY